MGSSLSSEQPQENEGSTEVVSCQRMSVEAQISDSRRRRNRVTILTEILRVKAKLDENLVKENNAILRDFLESFILEMKKCDPTFALLYQCKYYTGSYYVDLRVSTPDEYDLNLILKLPFKLDTVFVQYHSQVPSYVKYYTTNEKAASKENGLAHLFENGYLMPDKVRRWMQKVVDKARKEYSPPRNIVQVNMSASGPARTIKLVKRNGDVIDIDLVPAIQCSLGLKPPGIDGRVYNKVKDSLECFLVPKPYQPSKQAPVNDLERSRLWRAHYPKVESQIIHDIGCVKPVIKLLKLLRDKENWKILASYYLKTIILWMLLDNSTSAYWKMDQIGERFLDALHKLADCVKNRKICYFFSSRYNLLEKLTEPQAANITNRLNYIIRDIEKDDGKLWEIFGCTPTM